MMGAFRGWGFAVEELAFSAAGSGGMLGKEGKEDWDPPGHGTLGGECGCEGRYSWISTSAPFPELQMDCFILLSL